MWEDLYRVIEQDLIIRKKKKEYLQSVKNKEFHKSTLAQHSVFECNKGILWNDVKTVSKSSGKTSKYPMEAVKIYARETQNQAMNRRDDYE